MDDLTRDELQNLAPNQEAVGRRTVRTRNARAEQITGAILNRRNRKVSVFQPGLVVKTKRGKATVGIDGKLTPYNGRLAIGEYAF
jgi:hypothetical protein